MKIYFENDEKTAKKIDSGDVNVCVVGAGTIGLPLATFLAEKNFNVICYDRNKERVDQINEGRVIFEYHELLKSVLENGKISATTDYESSIENSDVIFVCVPTPLTESKGIDISMLMDVAEKIGKNLQKGEVIVFESSVAIGTTNEVKKRVEEISGLKCGKDFGLAYCPERYNPGLPKEEHPEVKYDETERLYDEHKFNKIGRVLGAIDKKSLYISKAIYSKIIKARIKTVSSIETAEATKLLENIFRDVNIALVNELSKIYSKFNLDTFEIIDAAKSKPFAFLPHYPGAGVGGECIPVDTHYLIKQAEELGLDTRLMKAARYVNDSMPYYTIDILENAMKNEGKSLENSTVCLLGVSYKKNIDDTRLSPAFVIANVLKERNVNVKICDPVVNPSKIENYDTIPLREIFDNTDAIILVTDHDIFKSIDFSKSGKMKNKIFIDGRNFFVKDVLEKFGFKYKCIGKANE